MSAPPILDAAPYFWALDTGMYAAAGLQIKNHVSAGGAADIPALISGDFDIASSNTVSALLARTKGLPLQFVTGGAAGPAAHRKGSAALMVAPNSDIRDPSGLSGKSIGVNTLNNIDQLYAELWLRSKGVDPSTVKFQEISFPDQPAALLSGRIDAVEAVTPFSADLAAKGAKVIGYPYAVQPHVFISGFVATDSVVARDRAAVRKFGDVYARAVTAIQKPANRQRLLRVLAKRTHVSAEVLAHATFPVFLKRPDEASLAKTAAVMDREGLAHVRDRAEVVAKLSGRSVSGS